MSQQDAFDNGGPLERHLYFQWALYLLELGRYDRIDKFLEVYIFQPRLNEAHSVRTLCDATQLFWRLQFAGQDTAELRTQLFDSWKEVDLESEEAPVACSPLAIALKHVRELHSVQSVATVWRSSLASTAVCRASCHP